MAGTLLAPHNPGFKEAAAPSDDFSIILTRTLARYGRVGFLTMISGWRPFILNKRVTIVDGGQEDPFPHSTLSIVTEAVYERLRCLVPGDGHFEGSYLRLKIYTGVASIMCYGKSSGNS